MQTIFLKKSIH